MPPQSWSRGESGRWNRSKFVSGCQGRERVREVNIIQDYVFLFFISRVNVLRRLLMVDLREDEVKLEAFMIPLTSVFEQLGLDLPTHPSYRGRWRWR